jgi:hypothetical protein
MKPYSNKGQWLVVAVLAASACAPPVSSTGSSSIRTIDPNRVQGPYAPAGQQFSIRLDQSIDTMGSLRNGAFTARLLSPLSGSDGRVIAPTGALVHGSIHSLGSTTSPRVKLDFETVDTVYGPAPIQASIRAAQYRRYPGPVNFRLSPYAGDYYYGYGWGYWGGWPGWGPVGGGPWYGYGDWVPYRPNEVHLPAGAQLRLVLTRPVIPARTMVSPR